MIDRLTSKRMVIILVLVSASVILISGSRVWVAGSTNDVVTGATALQGRGSDIAPGAMAAALVGLASAVAAATSGRVVRVIAACSATLAAVLGAGVVLSVLANPGDVLGKLAAAGTGRSGTVAAYGQAGGWVWVALSATLVMGFGGLCALVGARRWSGLSSRFDPPVSGQAAKTPQPDPAIADPAIADPDVELGRRRELEWDQLTRGEDPTVEP